MDEFEMSIKKRLKNEIAEVRAEKAKVQVGKNGVTPAMITEIDSQLKLTSLVKIKFLQNFITENFDATINEITTKTKSLLIDKRGKTIIIYRSKPKS
ncbi:MAG: YhbY family RNA-binding protein [Asgard group archaeon]|nr:YhbY family RNA-binding protein [Asgard group archaeon]